MIHVPQMTNFFLFSHTPLSLDITDIASHTNTEQPFQTQLENPDYIGITGSLIA